jgi:hypothetical protein
MQYWPRDLAQRLKKRVGYEHVLCNMSDEKVEEYLEAKMAKIQIQDFLSGISASRLAQEDDLDNE